MPSIKELAEKKAALIAQGRKILDAPGEDGLLSAEQQQEYAAIETDIESLSDQIDAKSWQSAANDRLRAIEASQNNPMPRQIQPINPAPRTRGNDGAELRFDFGRAGTVCLRPNQSNYALGTEEYARQFSDYLRGSFGDQVAEQLGLMVGSDPKGGYLAPMGFVSTLIKFLDNAVFMRGLATVLPPTNAKSVGAVSYDTDYGDADWTPEVPAADIAEDDAARFGSRELTPHLLTKLVKASLKLVRSSSIDIASFLAQRLAYLFGITEEKAFLTGSGAQQPLGLFTESPFGITSAQNVVAASTTAFTADDLINALYDLKDAYVSRATWVVSREFRKRSRKLKDGIGNYLLVENNNGGTVTTLLERPLVVSEYVPATYTAGLAVAVVGDMSHYWIQDSMDFEIKQLMELFALRNQIGWIGHKETDGMPVLAEAFRRIVLAP